MCVKGKCVKLHGILFLYSSAIESDKGGVQCVTRELADFFEDNGIKCYYLSLHKSDTSFQDSRQYYLPDSYRFNTNNNIDFLVNFVNEYKVDVLINQGGISRDCSEFAYKVRGCNVKIISCIHNSLLDSIRNFHAFNYAKFKQKHLHHFLKITKVPVIQKILLLCYKFKYQKHYKALLNNSERVVLLSEAFKVDFAFFVDEQSSKVISISNPVPSRFNKTEYHDTKKSKTVLYVGRIDNLHKRVDLLLQIWSYIEDKHIDWNLKIVGGGPDLEKMKSYAEELNLKNISFEGFQDPIPYYRDASIFCMTSSNEGFGIVLVEAMKLGCVPIAFDSYPAVRDIIETQKNGLLVSPFDVKEYSLLLSLLMENPDLRLSLSEEGCKKAEEFSIQSIGKQWLKILDDVCV